MGITNICSEIIDKLSGEGQDVAIRPKLDDVQNIKNFHEVIQTAWHANPKTRPSAATMLQQLQFVNPFK